VRYRLTCFTSNTIARNATPAKKPRPRQGPQRGLHRPRCRDQGVRVRWDHGRIAVGGRLPPGEQQLLLEPLFDIRGCVGGITDGEELAFGAEQVAVERHRHIRLRQETGGPGAVEAVVEGR
jgi:hypothetical protein